MPFQAVADLRNTWGVVRVQGGLMSDPDWVGRVASDSSEPYRLTSVGFLLSGVSWRSMDPWDESQKIVATVEIFFKGHIFPEVTMLTTLDLVDSRSDREQWEETSKGLCAAEGLNKVEVKRLRLYSMKLPALNRFHMMV